MRIVSIVLISILFLAGIHSCSTVSRSQRQTETATVLNVNPNGTGQQLEITLTPGKYHNHPTFAVWIETMEESFIQTLFVTQSLGTGYYGHGALGSEKWSNSAGEQQRPATLPYWLHKRLPQNSPLVLPTPKNPIPDAYTGATPPAMAVINLKSDKELPAKFRLFMEVNQPWDWNEYWTNTKHDDPDYRTSCQPSLIYAVTVDLSKPELTGFLNPIGHGHYSGASGELFTDLSTITTAKNIFDSIKFTIR